MAEASVAVKIPPRIPPMTIMTSSRLGRASKKAFAAWAQVGRSETGYPRCLAIPAQTSMMDRPIRMPGK